MDHDDGDRHAHLWPGVPLALASAVLFGSTPPVSKLLLVEISPFLLAGLLYLGAGLGLAVVEVLRRLAGAERGEEAPISRADLPWLAAAILAGGVVAPVLLMTGLARTTASSGALLLNLEGLATMAIAWIVFRENVDRRLLAGAAAILAGAVVLSWTGEGLSLDAGGLLVAGACLAWGIDNNLTRKVSAANPVHITIWKGLVAGTVNVVLALASGGALPSPMGIASAGLLGFFAVGVSLVLFIRALRHLGSARTGAYFSLAPFIGALLAIGLLGEAVTLRFGLAAVLMAIGLWLHLSERHEHTHAHEAVEHDHLHTHDAHHDHVHDGPVSEPHAHLHRHRPLVHAHIHYPDLHHRHDH
jgi:drug/metabolite transporter (DMT)-like permease